jgi:mono/diheme cytochrome c family protein
MRAPKTVLPAFGTLVLGGAFALSVCLNLSASAEEPDRVDFARDVRPILEQTCIKCHGPEKQKGGLHFDRRKGAFGAADSGKSAIVPRKPAESELIRRVEAADADERMPPKAEPLKAAQIATLKRWIEQGASWPESEASPGSAPQEMVVTDEDRQHWSYRPLRAPDVPLVHDAQWCQTPIDRFILAALEARGIRPSPPADRRTLIRRLSFDLVGLPPAPDEVAEFAADERPDAWSQRVERQLGSLHYGERWGRHWLDAARYADSNGIESDNDRPDAWPYRDFVIAALNDDMPYDMFVRWQLAGDEYEPDDPRALAATGFLTAAPSEILSVPMEEEKLRLRFNELDDMAVTTVSAFLGLTLGCARCHDHKFDAIPTRDYYRLQCAFTTTARDHVLLANRADAASYRDLESQWNERLKAAQAQLNDWLAEQKKPHSAVLRNAKIAALPIGDDEKALLVEQPDSETAKKLAKQHEKALAVSDDDYRHAFSDEQRLRWDDLKAAVAAVQSAQPVRPQTALAIADRQPEPEPTWLLARGDFYSKKERLSVGFLTVLTAARPPEDYWATARQAIPAGRSTGQRRALADWITDVDQGAGALVARVMVNRVWQHHFGEGLVRTPGDFGVRGERPTHPDLLEWLAHRFVASGWRLKELHRLILTSAVYSQGTAFDADRSAVDPENRLLWRRRPKRLEAEVLRDTVLAVSGTLNIEPFGAAFKPPIPPEAMQARNTTDPYPRDAKDIPTTRRRTVYMFHKRVVQHPLLQAFDAPDAAVACARRNCTTVAPQALALLNDPFLRDRAGDFARRLTAEAGANPEERVHRAFLLTLSRPPNEMESAKSLEFLDTQVKRRAARDPAASAEAISMQALTDFCQAFFSLNEFIYVD